MYASIKVISYVAKLRIIRQNEQKRILKTSFSAQSGLGSGHDSGREKTKLRVRKRKNGTSSQVHVYSLFT